MAVKASRFLTHMKRLRDPEEPLARLFSRASHLGDRLGPALYQLPGSFHRDLPRLDAFLTRLPRRLADVPDSAFSLRTPIHHVMEFRHPRGSCRKRGTCSIGTDVGLCLHDKAGSTIVEPIVGPLLYVRFHGTSGHYHGSYPTRALDAWAARLVEQHRRAATCSRISTTIPTPLRPEARELRRLVARRLGLEVDEDITKTVVVRPRHRRG